MNKINSVLIIMSCMIVSCACAMAAPSGPVPSTPEPGTVAMFVAIGVSGAGIMLRKRRSK